jgi:di/tricarboxylate transporter
MIPQVLLLGAILTIALVLFAREQIPSEVTALGVVLALVFTGLLPEDRAFAGFGSDTVMTILGLLILTSALQRTGVVERAGGAILRKAGSQPVRLLVVVLIATSVVSAFISNTAATAFFLPVLFGIARKAKTSAAPLLMPMAFASILSSSVTLVSTSTNLVVSGMMVSHGLPPMGMFELAPVGLPIAIAGLVYVFLTRRFIPDRGASELSGDFGIRAYLSRIVLPPDSPFVGKTLKEADLPRQHGLRILKITREGRPDLVPAAQTQLRAGDVLLVEGTHEDIVKIKAVAGIDIAADLERGEQSENPPELSLAEGAILPGSHLIGRTVEDYALNERYQVQILGLNHHSVPRRKIGHYRMRLGDVLLLQGEPRNLARLEHENVLRILGPVESVEEVLPRHRRAGIALGIFATVLALGALNLMSMPVAMMLGAFLVFVTRCITPAEAYDCMEWKAIMLIGSMLSLGVAMEHTGIARFVAGHLTTWLADTGPFGLLTLFFVLTVLLTQPMSNQAAAIVILPIALATATQTGMNPRAFAMMIAVAASCSYLTPLEPSCMMVYGPGRYRFVDFLKIGGPLTILVYVIAILLVPRIWPVTAG